MHFHSDSPILEDVDWKCGVKPAKSQAEKVEELSRPGINENIQEKKGRLKELSSEVRTLYHTSSSIRW
ncbi:MAG: hypothetical protein LBF54_04545 [Holosporaceae bacterium]|nr:hypothetical protein [Holosporaceae bacterium]